MSTADITADDLVSGMRWAIRTMLPERDYDGRHVEAGTMFTLTTSRIEPELEMLARIGMVTRTPMRGDIGKQPGHMHALTATGWAMARVVAEHDALQEESGSDEFTGTDDQIDRLAEMDEAIDDTLLRQIALLNAKPAGAPARVMRASRPVAAKSRKRRWFWMAAAAALVYGVISNMIAARNSTPAAPPVRSTSDATRAPVPLPVVRYGTDQPQPPARMPPPEPEPAVRGNMPRVIH